MIKVGIVGGAGYTGGELIRLLLNHPNASIHFVHSTSNAGHPLHKVHADLLGETDLLFSAELSNEIDLLFLCMGHGDAAEFLQANEIAASIKIIDLSQDFRLNESPVLNGRTFVYGLPELNREAIIHAQNIANPGCFATAIQLGLLPLAKAGVLTDIYTTGITGSTGAGQGLSSTSHFSWRANNIEAYKTLAHQHIKEITQSLNQLQVGDALSASGEGNGLHFVPWRGDFTRGIYISSIVEIGLPFDEVKHLYQSFYADAACTIVSDKMINLKQVVNTNKCLIHLEKQGNKLVVHSAIDNLLKGASGQAVQNMNLLFGLNEKAGLKLKASYF
ncbi:N-acetyl-gamma-glutamyl-phosphate reductase [Sediminibacterium sp.]|uniref:N-acetyl-gamma-glutamyl-phosphate reductase n=1 Tax=Sediminibacterium sp. TaxID=1917865 RepID=UPI0025FC9755|nr:N-acetyl-gamma-glutamyl-phosphate reductase [Sediminibacterium sp.]